MTAVSAEPVELPLQTDRAQFLRNPGVDRRGGQRIGGLPARLPVLQGDRRVEGTGFEAQAPAVERIRAPLQIGFGQVDRVLVVTAPVRGVQMHRPDLPDVLGYGEAQPAEPQTGLLLAEAQRPESSIQTGPLAVRAHQAGVELQLPVGGARRGNTGCEHRSEHACTGTTAHQ